MCSVPSPLCLGDRLPEVAGFAARARRIFNMVLVAVFFNTSDRAYGGARIRIGSISAAQ